MTIRITDVQVRPIRQRGETGTRVVAFATLWLDCGLRLHNFRVLVRPSGDLKIEFPDRPRTNNCPNCECPVTRVSRFCSQCGIAVERQLDRPTHIRSIDCPDRDDRETIETAILEAAVDALAEAEVIARRQTSSTAWIPMHSSPEGRDAP